MHKHDLTGQRFGRLTVVKYSHKGNSRNLYWLCRCDCGTFKAIGSGNLKKGTTKSCGCLKSEITSKRNRTHGHKRHPLYAIWRSIKGRCLNSNRKEYYHYGGRGIMVCEEWLDAGTFIKWALANGWQKGLQIDRENNNGNYEPGNCRFVTAKVNSNNRRSSKEITYEGQTKRVTEWAEAIGIPYRIIWQRLNYRWPVERAFNEPVHTHIK